MSTEHHKERVEKNTLALTRALSPRERENHRPRFAKWSVLWNEVRQTAWARETGEFSSGGAALFPLLGERIKVRASVSLLILTVSLVFTSFAPAQNFTIDWFTIDGGGGTSTGGVYSVSGTIGQADAGTMSGGNFTVDGGFWGIIAAVQTPGAPLLTITLNSQLSTITLSWPSPSTGFVLQQNTNGLATVNWSNVLTTPSDNGTTKTVIVNPPTGNRFYRLKNP